MFYFYPSYNLIGDCDILNLEIVSSFRLLMILNNGNFFWTLNYNVFLFNFIIELKNTTLKLKNNPSKQEKRKQLNKQKLEVSNESVQEMIAK